MGDMENLMGRDHLEELGIYGKKAGNILNS
jgi:hypothetical protein